MKRGTGIFRLALCLTSAVCLFAAPAFCTGGSGIIANADKRASDPIYGQAETERKSFNYLRAAQLYEQYLKQYPGDESALEYRALCLFWGGKTAAGIQGLSDLIKRNPKHWAAYLHRANMRSITGDLDNIIADTDMAIKLAPDSERDGAYSAKVNALRTMRHFPEALQLATEALKQQKVPSPTLHVQLARIYADMNEVASAEKEFEIAEKIGCEGLYEVEHANLYKTHDPARSSRMLFDLFSRTEQSYLQGHPAADFNITMKDLFYAFLDRKDYTHARDCVQWLLRSTQSHPSWLIKAADVSCHLNETTDAVKYLKQIPDYQNNSEAVGHLIHVYRLQRNLRPAEALARNYLQSHPHDLEIRADLAELLITDAHVDEALEWLDFPEAERLGGSIRYWSTLTEAALLKSDFPRAARSATRALAFDPKNQQLLLKRGSALFRMNKYPQALVDCNRALAIQPNSASEYSLRGMIYFKLGDRKAALNDFSYAIEHAGVNEQHLTRATRAMALACEGSWGNARKDVMDAFRVRPTGLETFVVAAEVNLGLNRVVESAAMEDSAFLLEFRISPERARQ